jgi:hypothetical protein
MKASLAISLLQWAKKKLHIYLLYSAIVIDVIICLVVVFYFFLQCQPISYAWLFLDPTVKGTCWPMSGQILIGYALSGTTISLDMLFLFVPFFMLSGRGVSMRVKMYIYAIFGLGVLYVSLVYLPLLLFFDMLTKYPLQSKRSEFYPPRLSRQAQSFHRSAL